MATLAEYLNTKIESDPQSGTFRGGQGIVIRNLDDDLINSDECKVVPGSFWHNDIWSPNQIYPAKTDILQDGKKGTNWVAPTLAVAIAGTESFGRLFSTSNVHDDTWIDGVWYAHDSNCCDKRALWVPASQGYDAPYAWIDQSGKVSLPQTHKRGSGHYGPGNPTVNPPLGGGGTGPHVANNYPQAAKTNTQEIDQIDGKRFDRDRPLVADYYCQIDYRTWNTKGTEAKTCDIHEAVRGWLPWIEAFAKDAEKRGGDISKREAWIADLAMGWVNNPRPMITLQNALWKYRDIWCDKKSTFPPDPNSDGRYWGWNEIPFDKGTINNPANWKCFIIVLPPGFRHLKDVLNNRAAQKHVVEQQLVEQLNSYRANHSLHAESTHSSVALARQIKDPHQPDPNVDSVTVWKREFFTEDVTIGGGWSIRGEKFYYKKP